jgi:hypothetical protein
MPYVIFAFVQRLALYYGDTLVARSPIGVGQGRTASGLLCNQRLWVQTVRCVAGLRLPVPAFLASRRQPTQTSPHLLRMLFASEQPLYANGLLP